MTRNSGGATIEGNSEVRVSDEFIAFYYMTIEELNETSFIVSIKINDSRGVMFYISIVLLVIASLIFIYSIIALVKYCVEKRNARQISNRYIIDPSPSEIEERYKKILKIIPEVSYDKSKDKYEQANCSICLSEFENGTRIRMLSCKHIFHTGCIESWIKAKINSDPKCPTCNTELKTEVDLEMAEADIEQPQSPDRSQLVSNENQGQSISEINRSVDINGDFNLNESHIRVIN